MKRDLTLKLQSNSSAQTISYGKLFSKTLKGGDLVVLAGSLGGGKTTFTKGILKGLGCRKKILSPSFTLMRQYRAKNFWVYHVDLYRLDKKQAWDLGIDDFIYSGEDLTLIEWGERIASELKKYIEVKFSYLAENKRQLVISAPGYSREKLTAIERIYRNEPLSN